MPNAAARRDLSAPPPLSDAWQRQRLFEALAHAVITLQQPLLVLLDDLQWADKETLEWLHFLLRFAPAAPLLLLGTVRMSEVTADHPLIVLQQQLHRAGRIQEMTLPPLTTAASDELAQQIAGSHLSPSVLAGLRHYAEGVPLFLVEAVRAEIGKAETDRWQWSSIALHANQLPLPPKVYAVIQARLGQLSAGARQVANMAAIIGRSFSLELLTLATNSDEASLIQNLDELWQRRIMREQGANYDLSHDRIRDVAYAELSPIQRKRLHRQVAAALAQRHAANLDAVSSELARHYEAAGLFAEAVEYYLRAGEAAQQIYAHDHACELFKHGLVLTPHLPDILQREQQELALLSTLAASLRLRFGWASTEMYAAVNRAWQLSHKLNDTHQRLRLVKFLFSYHVVQGDLDQSSQLADQLLEFAKQDKSDLAFVNAYSFLGTIDLARGKVKSSQEYFDQSLSYYDPQYHHRHILLDGVDYGLLSGVWSSHTLWALGYPDQAVERCWTGINLARQFKHPLSEAMAWAYLTMLYYLRQEIHEIAHHAEICLNIVKEYNIGYYLLWANIYLAWTQAFESLNEQGIVNR